MIVKIPQQPKNINNSRTGTNQQQRTNSYNSDINSDQIGGFIVEHNEENKEATFPLEEIYQKAESRKKSNVK